MGLSLSFRVWVSRGKCGKVSVGGRGKCGKVSVGGCQAATCGHSSGCKWLPAGCKWLPETRDCWRPLAATRVAASGCHFQNQITRLLRAQWDFYKISMMFLWDFFGIPMVFVTFLWEFHDVSMIFPWDYYGMSEGILWDSSGISFPRAGEVGAKSFPDNTK